MRPQGGKQPRAKSVIYIFLSGGLAQHDSFDLKPDAPDNIRGEFKPIATRTPGIQICEHLPLLAARSQQWALVRSLTHPSNEHSDGHHIMLTGRTPMPPGFDAGKPKPTDWPSIAAVAGDRLLPANNLPPAVVLPERLIHCTGRVIPGQFAGDDGQPAAIPGSSKPSPFNAKTYGAYPEYEFDHETGPAGFQARVPGPEPGAAAGPVAAAVRRPPRRCGNCSTASAASWKRPPRVEQFDRYRQDAISLLTDAAHAGRVRRHAGRRQDAGPLRPQRLRLVAADGPAAGRGGREPGAGEPRQQRNLGHAPIGVPAPEELPAAADRPGGVGAARRPGRARPA